MKSISYSTLNKLIFAAFIVCMITGMLLRIYHVSAFFGSTLIGIAFFLLLVVLVLFMFKSSFQP